MLPPLYALLALLPTLTLTATPNPPTLYTATLHTLPTTTPSVPNPLAILTYHPLHPSLSHISTFTPPPNSTTDPDALTQIAIYFPNSNPQSEHYRTSATSIRGFHAPYKGRFRITVRPEDGEVMGASWRAWMAKEQEGDGNGNGRGDFDIVTVKQAPPVVFDKPVKGKGGVAVGIGPAVGAGVEGEEEVVEKTLLQKYWWLLLGVAVLAMTGGGGEK